MVRDLSHLVHGDPVLRMNLTRAIDDARDAGYELGYGSIDELIRIVDYRARKRGCAVFRPGVIDTSVPQPPYRDDGPPIRVNAHLATAKRSRR